MKIHLAILDYMMPKLRGDQLTRRLIQIDQEIKIIFVSGYNEVIEVAKKLEFDVFGVFMKPFDPDVMEKLAESNDHANFKKRRQYIKHEQPHKTVNCTCASFDIT